MTMFWTLTDDEIRRGMDYVHDSRLRERDQSDPMIMFVYDSNLVQMAFWLMDCDWDRDLMRLKYADEIAALNKPLDSPWFTPAGLHRGQMNVFAAGSGVGKSKLNHMVVDIEVM
jgi:hypothetical protein